MGYLNYNACTLGEGLSSSVDCNANNAIGVQNFYLATKGAITGVTINASGICTSIGVTSGKKFYAFNPLDETVLYKETGSRSKNGNTTWVQTLTFTNNSWSDQARDTIDLIVRTQSQGVVTLTNGNSYLIGVFSTSNPAASTGLKATKAEWTSGQNADDELSGTDVELTGKGGIKAIRINDALLATSIFA